MAKQEKYHETLYFASQNGMQDMICFKDKTSTILREHHANLQLGEEKNQIIKTALKLICNDIATINLDPKTYPTVQNMGNISSQLALVPESLQMFLRPILKTDEKVAIWGQNFIKAYWPRSGVLPYQMGLAIQLDHKFGSKWMLNKLHRLGYSESYAELHNYKYCFLNNKKRVCTSNSSGTLDTIVEETDDQINAEFEVDVELENLSALMTISESATPYEVSIEIEGINSSRAVTQFVGDNIDLNIVSINGNNSFHSMGFIKVTSAASPSADDNSVERVKLKPLDKTKILKACDVQILPFTTRHQTGIETITFIPIADLVTSIAQDKPLLSPGDVLWAAGWVIKAQNSKFQHSNWNGWMKRIHAEDAKPTTQIDFLPVIEGDPNEHRTIFTTLKECLWLSKEKVAVETFDLPI